MSELILPHIWLPHYNFPGRSRICLPEEKDLRAFFAGLVNGGMINAGHALTNAGIIRASLTPPVAGPFAWFRSDLGLYTDSAMTTPVTADGDRVGAWADLSGNGNHVLQTDNTYRPTYKTNRLNGYPSVLFSRTAKDALQTATFGAITGFTVCAVIRVASTGANYRRIWQGDGSNGSIFLVSNTAHWGSFNGSSVVQSAASVSTNTWYRTATLNVKPGPNCEIFVNDVSVAGANAGTTTLTRFSLSENAGAPGTDGMDGDEVEVLVYSSLLNTTQLTTIYTAWGVRYSL